MATKLTFTVLACVLLAAAHASPQQVGGIPGGNSGGIVGGVPSQPDAPPRSEAELKAAIASRPSEFLAYLQLAQLYRITNRIAEADQVLRSALPIAPNPAMVYGVLISLYDPQYNPEQVLAVADEWRQAQPANVVPLLTMANAHVALARRLRPTPHEARLHLEHAMRAIEDAKALQPESPAIGMNLATVLRAKADLETDPAERDSLLRQADEAMSQMQARIQRRAGSRVEWQSAQGLPPSYNGAIRVGGNIRQPQKIKDAKPLYPPEAQQARVEGVVILEVVVDENGKVKDAQVLRSIPMLDAAAMDAVRQWEFSTTLLNGQAVPVIMTVTVQFSLP
jgi:TonB family protein